MFYNGGMNALVKLKDIAVHMDLEPAEEVGFQPALVPGMGAKSTTAVAPCGQVVGPQTAPSPTPRLSKQDKKRLELGITHAKMGGGKTLPMLKTMLTTACERNCGYCPFRAGRTYRRHTLSPAEMAQSFMNLYNAGMVEGLFLSSGIIKGGVATQDKLIDTADILRNKHQFNGYLHLKIMPGAEKDQIARAMQLADRLSVNLEGPNEQRLQVLAPMKQLEEELLRPLHWIEEIRRSRPASEGWNGRWPSSVTQFVVGGADETDLELLNTSEYLYRRLGLRRAYFSTFRPIADTPLDGRAPENPLRSARLYQASFLFRDYGFDLEDMPFGQDGNLPLDLDPKLAWARAHLQETPVELNRAERDDLLRVPGIGPKSAYAIVRARRLGTLRDLHDLHKIGVRTKRLAPYVLLDGQRPLHQLPLFRT